MMVFDQVQDYEGQQEEKAAQVIQERWLFFATEGRQHRRNTRNVIFFSQKKGDLKLYKKCDMQYEIVPLLFVIDFVDFW